jgi:hypothetical protein
VGFFKRRVERNRWWKGYWFGLRPEIGPPPVIPQRVTPPLREEPFVQIWCSRCGYRLPFNDGNVGRVYCGGVEIAQLCEPCYGQPLVKG